MPDEPATFEPTRRQWVGYWCMIVQQSQNAFNDKMAQFILVSLGGAVAFSVESMAGLLIALPYVLFAPIAGWLSDRFSKRDVMIGSAALQLVVLVWICLAVKVHSMPLALLGFFSLAVQAAFFSPAKIGINKELVGSGHLGFATGIQQMTSMLAMLIGQIIAGWLFDHRYRQLGPVPANAWWAALGLLLVLTATSVPTVLLAWIIPRVPVQGSGKFTLNLTVSHFKSLSDLWRDVPLRRASLGVAFFWGFAAYINLWAVKLAKVLTGGGEGFGTMSSMFMAAASLGMATGFGFAALLLRRRIELGWVPVAGLAMTAVAAALVFLPQGGPVFLGALVMLAFFSALYLAPLNAWMQDRYPAAKRGELQSASNLQDCFSGIVAVAIITGFELGAKALRLHALIGIRIQMAFIAVMCLLATLYIIRLLPADFLRVIFVAMVRAVYRIRVAHGERLPPQGGVLLLPNHVTFADAFFISSGCPRPLRFVMEEALIEHPAIRAFSRIFETMTIRREQPLEAIRAIIRALNQGDVVCLFPEGQLTRTGTLSVLQKGFELIARKSNHPLLPVWCDGSWGSIFSFERNRYFRKVPYRLRPGVIVAFGEEIAPKNANLEAVRNGLLSASAAAIGQRFAAHSWGCRKPRAGIAAATAFPLLDETAARRMWINGHQIGTINALQRQQPIHVLRDDPVLTEMPGLFAAFPALFGSKLRIEPEFRGELDGVWVGGDALRGKLLDTRITGAIRFHDFGMHALEPLAVAGVEHFPGLAVAGVVVAMAMPEPPAGPDNFEPQHGHKPQSWGKLLPGWFVTGGENGALRVHGPAAPEEGLALPEGAYLDEEGFLDSEALNPKH